VPSENEQAPAKVNLWLKVVGRRADGYHLLDSLVAFADLSDQLEVTLSDGLSLVLAGPGAAALAGEPNNLVLKAARLLAAEAGVEAHAAIKLTKHIPMAAGLGGGSADAAAALRALCRLWRINLSQERLLSVAARLGADVPMCLVSRPAVVTGVGERLKPILTLPACGVLLANPGVALATPAVFAMRRRAFSQEQPVERAWSDLADLVEALAARGNDLTEAALALQPVVGDVLSALKVSAGARYVAMSGSGATCFALYDTPADAARAAASMPGGWWRHAGRFASFIPHGAS
jgi:4-diphosphocytidyl-2-C-methyl-D-erythritol kinase